MSYAPAFVKHMPPADEKYTSTADVKIRKLFISSLSLDDNCATATRIHNTSFFVWENDHRNATG